MSDQHSFTPHGQKPYDSSRSVARGVAWAVGMRWLMRFIGLFSTLILARLLSPDDFGVAALGILVVHFLFEMSEMGTSMHLIRAKHIDREHCDTAWTITLIQGFLAAMLLMLLAYPASSYFGEPRVVGVMYVLALASLVGGLENIGPVLARRDLMFALDFRFNVYKKLLIFFATIGSALVYKNYWALVIGQLTGTLAGVILSYILFSYRPKFSLQYFKEYLQFGMSIMPLRLATTLRGMAPSFLIAGLDNTAAMGAFRVATDLSSLFTKEIVTPMGRGLLPNYVRLAESPDELSAVYRRVLGLVAMVCIPMAVGVAAVAQDLTLVLLGPQWDFAATLMKYLALGAAIFAISQAMVNQLLIATKREKTAAILSWVRLLITVPVLWLGMELQGAVGLSKAVIMAGILCFPLVYNETRRAVNLPLGALFGLFWRPTTAAALMYFAIRVGHNPDTGWAILRLLQDVFVGALTFVSTILLLWFIVGRPVASESVLVEFISGLPAMVRRRLS